MPEDNEQGNQTLHESKLEWKKIEGFIDEYSEMTSTTYSPNGVVIDFGKFDYKAKKKSGYVEPYIALCSRIRMSPGSLKSFVDGLIGVLADVGEEDEVIDMLENKLEELNEGGTDK